MIPPEQLRKIKQEFAGEKDRLSDVLVTLGEPGRLRIFKLLTKHQDLCVTEVASIFGITVSAASQQLRMLELVGIVKKVRMGQKVCYELKKDSVTVKNLITFVRSNELTAN